ncbi:hypothetical protein M885DRAFT_574066 [Pelagophyceae sp. CCMP2097]|nr:hypothetical protein M885DRAFT_574066 [Pelagophyceae sp. CCMP2097]
MLSVRVKRKASTIFLNVEKSDSFGVVKQKISDILHQPSAGIKLFTAPDAGAGDLQDTAFVDTFLESDAILYMTFQKDGGAWEDIDVQDGASPSAP